MKRADEAKVREQRILDDFCQAHNLNSLQERLFGTPVAPTVIPSRYHHYVEHLLIRGEGDGGVRKAMRKRTLTCGCRCFAATPFMSGSPWFRLPGGLPAPTSTRPVFASVVGGGHANPQF